MKNIKLYILIIISSLVGFILLFFKIFGVIQPAGQAVDNPVQFENIGGNEIQNTDEAVVPTISLSLDYSNGQTLSFGMPYQQSSTAYSILQQALEQNNIEMEAQTYDFGVFVKSINGLQSTQNMAWIYFINGESGNVSADNYQLNPGDRVEWKFIAPEEN